jgi:hypothetical protein
MVRRVVISYGQGHTRILDQICELAAPLYRTPLRDSDAVIAVAIFQAFPEATLDDIIIARDMLYRGWQPSRAVA